jgi:hypothetical protein
MGKDLRHTSTKMHKQVHRSLLKQAGTVHLPSNKVHTPKNAYKRKKFHKSDLLKIQD